MRSLYLKTTSVTALVLALGLLSACGPLLRSEYQRPQLDMPEQWQGPAVTGSAVAGNQQWWRNFNDPVLDGLIERALRSNNDLAAATVRVRRARLQSELTDTNLTPDVTVSATSSFSRDLKHNSNSQTYGVNGSLSYELDLWGRLARLREAGRWEAEATEVDRRNTALVLIGTTAADYWQVAYLNQRIATGEASIAYAEKALELVQVKYRAGSVSGIDLVQARQAVATQKANHTQLLQQRAEARNALAILFDQAPEHGVQELDRLPTGPLPAIKPGLPAHLLSQRPDLHAAELRLRESLANVDATKAGFYPTFTLTGSLGSSSTTLANVLQNPVGTLGAGLVLPFVQWQSTRLNIKVSQTQYEEAVVNFRQTLYKALSDVENALSNNVQLQAEGIELEQALASARQSEQLAEIRYRAGATGVQQWLDEQERRRTAETALAGNQLNRLNNMMKLYQALGGEMGDS